MYYDSSVEQYRDVRVQTLAEQLYREHYPRLLRIAVSNAANRTDAEEAVQFAFLAFLQKFDPESGAPPLAWVTTYADLRVMPTLVGKPTCRAEIAPMRSA